MKQLPEVERRNAELLHALKDSAQTNQPIWKTDQGPTSRTS